MGKMRLPLYTGKIYIHYSVTRKMRLPLYTGKNYMHYSQKSTIT